MQEWLDACETADDATDDDEPCSSCDGRGHVVERWTGRYWLTLRGCNVCGMRGEICEFARENNAKRRAADEDRCPVCGAGDPENCDHGSRNSNDDDGLEPLTRREAEG